MLRSQLGPQLRRSVEASIVRGDFALRVVAIVAKDDPGFVGKKFANKRSGKTNLSVFDNQDRNLIKEDSNFLVPAANEVIELRFQFASRRDPDDSVRHGYSTGTSKMVFS